MGAEPKVIARMEEQRQERVKKYLDAALTALSEAGISCITPACYRLGSAKVLIKSALEAETS